MKTSTNLFVLFSDDAHLADALTAVLPPEATLRVASSYQELIKLAKQPSVRGLVVDAPSLAGRIVHRLERLRSEAPLVRLLFVVADPQHWLNDLQPLRIELVDGAAARPAGQRVY